MMQCWQAGELRAFLDEELPPGDMERLAAHLEECAACGELCHELRRQAGWVASALSALPAQEAVSRMPSLRRRSTAGWRWASVLVAAAASMALAWLLLSPKAEKLAVPAARARVVSRSAPAAPPPVTVKPAIIRRVLPRKPAAPAKPKPQLEYFLALDDDPVEAGIVVRVALNNGVPADVIVGTDGRAHAIRLVSSVTGER